MTQNQFQRPRIGVGVLVLRNNRILLGKRKNSHGEGTWQAPGGHLEFGESPEACAKREVLEEAGITIKNLRRGPFTNDFFSSENKHYVTLFMIADSGAEVPTPMEPEKCEKWDWFSWKDLPTPLFLPLQNLIKTDFTL